jgi:hypothetical protein
MRWGQLGSSGGPRIWPRLGPNPDGQILVAKIQKPYTHTYTTENKNSQAMFANSEKFLNYILAVEINRKKNN